MHPDDFCDLLLFVTAVQEGLDAVSFYLIEVPITLFLLHYSILPNKLHFKTEFPSSVLNRSCLKKLAIALWEFATIVNALNAAPRYSMAFAKRK